MKKTLSVILAVVLLTCTISSFLMIFALKGCATDVSLNLEINDMKVNGLKEPLGIDTTPVFSWKNVSNGYNRSMSAYRIIVASTKEKAEKFEGDLWDSGKTQGSNNYDIIYNGASLSSVTDYYWRVSVYDERDVKYDSEIVHFGTGMLSKSEWTASWIGAESEKTFDFSGANWIWSEEAQKTIETCKRYFRKSFTPDSTKTVKKVFVGGTADDSIKMYFNGEQIASSSSWQGGFFTDITNKVVAGNNTFAAVVSNTFTETGSYAAFILKAQIYYTDGTKEEIVTDASWVLNDTELTDWANVSFNDSAWAKATIVGAYPIKPWNQLNIDTTILTQDESAPYLRKEFNVSKSVKNAKMLICGLGLFELKINGILPDDTVLNPANTQYDDTVNYRVFDVTSLIQSGENAIGVELGNSWYNENFEMWSIKNAPWRDNPKLLAELHIVYDDGTKEIIKTDTSWKVSLAGPTTYNSIYHGEKYDARLEIKDWDKATYDDSLWKNAVIAKTPGALKFENMEPMRKLNTFPCEITKLLDGTYIVKVPVMTTGWAKITFRNTTPGETVKIAYGETLKANGKLNYVDWGTSNTSGGPFQLFDYTFKGAQEESYEPKFTYCGYQYIEISNYSGTLTPEDVKCYLIANDVEKTGEFETDNELINTLHDNMARALINNFQGKPTDCPTWEKLGWLGDYNVIVRTAMYNYGIQAFNEKFMNDIRDSAINNKMGNISPMAGTAPGNVVVWNCAYVEAIYESWLAYGTIEIAQDHYDLMRANTLTHVDTIKKTVSSGGLSKPSWVFEHEGALNDWQGPNGPSSAPEGYGIVATATFYSVVKHLREMALALGKTDDANEYAVYLENIYNAFNETFYNEEKGYYETGYWNPEWAGTRSEYRQTSNLAAVYYGLCPEDKLESVVASIANDVISKDYHLETGHIGTRLLLPVLSEYGYEDVAYKLITQTTYPSWGFWVENGATSCWEGYSLADTRSRNHYFLGTYDQWLFENVAGIDEHTNGYETVVIKPQMIGDLKYVNSSIKTVRGALESNWKKFSDGSFEMVVNIPMGTTATIYVPVYSTDNLRVNGVKLSEHEGILSYEIVDGNVKITAGSGNYEFVVSALFEDISDAKANLESLVNIANNFNKDNYDEEIWQAFTKVLEDTVDVLNDKDTTNDQYVIAQIKLSEQISILNRNKSGNLALGATVTTGGELDHPHWNNPQTLTDGDLKNYQGDRNTGWCCTGYQDEKYLIIDLGSAYNVNNVRLYATGNTDTDPVCKWFPKAFDVLVSTNGTTFNKVGSKSGIPATLTAKDGVGPYVDVYFDTTVAQFIKIDITALQDKIENVWYAQLSEAEVYSLNESELKYHRYNDVCNNVNKDLYLTTPYNEFIASVKDVISKEYTSESEYKNAADVLENALNTLNKHTVINLALGKNVSASTSHAVATWSNPQKLTDGDTVNLSGNQHTGWSCVSNDANVYVQIDLGDVYAFNTVNLYPTGNTTTDPVCAKFPKGYEIQISENGTTWNTVYSASGLEKPQANSDGTVNAVTNQFELVSARFVKVVVTQKHSDSGLIQFAEIEVYRENSYILDNLLKEYNGLNKSDYDETVYNEFNTIINKINAQEYTNQNDTFDAIHTLDNAIIKLNKNTTYNLAEDKDVITSSTHSNAAWNNPQKLTDGDRMNLSSANQNTGWSSTSTDTELYVDIDLGDKFLFNTVDLYPTGNVGANKKCTYFPKGYMIQTSDDGINWITVYTVEGLTQPYSNADGSVDAVRSQFKSSYARYVRIKVTEKNEALVQFAEIEVYNTISKFVGANIELAESLTVNYFVDSKMPLNDLSVRFTSTSGRITDVFGTIDEETGYYKFSYTGINPQCMNDFITAQLISGENVIAQKDAYSVNTYCENQISRSASELGLTNTQYAKLKTLLADMLVYGSAAQDYMDYKTDNLTDNSQWVQENKSTFTVPNGVKVLTGNNDLNNCIKSASLNMSNVNKIYFRLILTDDSVKVLLNNVEIDKSTLIKQADGTYVIYTDDLKATEFDKVFTLTLVDANNNEISKIQYNVNAYIQAKYGSSTVGNIVKALNNYGVSAKAYLNSLSDLSGDYDLEDEDILI